MAVRVHQMLLAILLGVAALMLSTVLIGDDSRGENKMVTLNTSLGVIILQLDAGNAPGTVANFCAYEEGGDYDGI